jgi:hypothetical protein
LREKVLGKFRESRHQWGGLIFGGLDTFFNRPRDRLGASFLTTKQLVISRRCTLPLHKHGME